MMRACRIHAQISPTLKRILNCIAQKFAAVFEIHLLFDVFTVRFDSLDADEQQFGNLANDLSLPQQLKHFKLPITQHIRRTLTFGALASRHLLQHRRLHRFAYKNAARQDRADRADDLFARFLFVQISLGPRANGPLAVH